jgi:hypothetical protein
MRKTLSGWLLDNFPTSFLGDMAAMIQRWKCNAKTSGLLMDVFGHCLATHCRKGRITG